MKERKKPVDIDPEGATREFDPVKTPREEVSFTYEEEEELLQEEERRKKRKIPKAVYRVGVILLLVVVGLALWLSRDKLHPENIVSWVKLQFVGSQEGDGFPVPVTGSVVAASNFTSYNSNACILSDTAFTMLSPSGKELLSLRHSYNEPVMRTAYGSTLLYNWGGTGYTVLNGAETQCSGALEQDILAGDVAQSGRFALACQGSDGASELNVYQKDGTLQFHYLFVRDYITAVALNYDGAWGMVCTMRGENGGMVSKVTVFDFNRPEPVAEYEVRDVLLLDAYWAEGGWLCAVGDSALLAASSSDYEFTEFGYGGRQVTAYTFAQNRVFLSISAYEHAGPSTLVVFREGREQTRIEFDQRVISLSASGGTVAALVGSTARLYDYSTGQELAKAEAGSDAKALALSSEKAAYVLGVSEIRTLEPGN